MGSSIGNATMPEAPQPIDFDALSANAEQVYENLLIALGWPEDKRIEEMKRYREQCRESRARGIRT